MTSPSMTANDRRPPFAIKPEITSADLRRGAWASSIGSALEYYDFALYSLASALIFGALVLPQFQSRRRPPCQLWNLFFGLRHSASRGSLLWDLGRQAWAEIRFAEHGSLDGTREHLDRRLANPCDRQCLGSRPADPFASAARIRSARGTGWGFRPHDGICPTRQPWVSSVSALYGHHARRRGCGSGLFSGAGAHRKLRRNLALAHSISP